MIANKVQQYFVQSSRFVGQSVVRVVLLLKSAFRDVGKSDNTSRRSVSPHCQRNSVQTEGFGLFVAHSFPVVCVNVAVNEATAGPSHCVVPEQSSTSEVDAVDLRSLVRVPAGNDIARFESLLVVGFLEHPGRGFDVRQFALLIGVGVDEVAYFVGSLLGLAGKSASQDDDVLMDIVDFVGNSVDHVDSSGRGPWVKDWLLESAQAMTPLSYLMAMMVVPMVSLG